MIVCHGSSPSHSCKGAGRCIPLHALHIKVSTLQQIVRMCALMCAQHITTILTFRLAATKARCFDVS